MRLNAFDKRVKRILPILALASVLLTGCTTLATPETPATPQPTQTPTATQAHAPEGFSYLRDVDPEIKIELRYATTENFTGSVVEGYSETDAAMLRDEAAAALGEVQAGLADEGLGLLVWDSFRPTRAVDDFVSWSHTADDSTKAEYYPDHEKAELFELGYVAEQSMHSLGGTVDLTLVTLPGGEQLDMGGPFDFFGDLSHYDAEGLTAEQQANRATLREAMERRGFEPYPLEWWHFTYPLPEATERADFPVE